MANNRDSEPDAETAAPTFPVPLQQDTVSVSESDGFERPGAVYYDRVEKAHVVPDPSD